VAFKGQGPIHGAARRLLDRLSPGKVLAILGGLAGLIVALVGLLYQFAPQFVPCVAGTQATISATVVPMTYGDYYDFALVPPAGGTKGTREYERNVLGVSVGWTAQLSNLRDQDLTIASTLLSIGPGGSLKPLYDAKTAYRVLQPTFTTNQCSDQRGGDFFVPVPAPGPHRILVELFETQGGGRQSSDARLALTETDIFTLPASS
jgi:hypothetical protein